jgi:hypothetical protein
MLVILFMGHGSLLCTVWLIFVCFQIRDGETRDDSGWWRTGLKHVGAWGSAT